MTRAVLKNGVICPLEAIPPEWAEGQELQVQALPDEDDNRDLDDWYRELNRMVGSTDPAEWESVEHALKVADEQAKADVRKQMGLP